jgi:hypothetical protein
MTTATFPETLQAEVAALQAQHPILAGALDKAFALVVGGGVFPLEDGHTAHVRSQSDPTVSHLVNGTCDCKATRYHAAPCAHRLAFRVYQRTALRLTGDPAEERWEPVEAPAPAPLYEAPASVNCHIMLEGRQVQVTLRDTDEQRLLERLASVLRQYPVLPSPHVKNPRSPSGETSDTGQPGWCQMHQVAMTLNEKHGRTWLSHRTADGQWCKGR